MTALRFIGRRLYVFACAIAYLCVTCTAAYVGITVFEFIAANDLVDIVQIVIGVIASAWLLLMLLVSFAKGHS